MKKFLTVLLALSVVFTYSFSAVGTAFAAAPTDADEFKTAVQTYKDSLAYAGGYLDSNSVTDVDANWADVISKEVIENAIDVWADNVDLTTVDYVDATTKGLSSDAKTNLWSIERKAEVVAAQYDIEFAKYNDLVASIDPKAYNTAGKTAIETALKAADAAIAGITTGKDMTALTTVNAQIVALKKAVADNKGNLTSVTAETLAAQIADLKNTLVNVSEDFYDAVKADYAVETTDVELAAKKASFEKDFAAVVAYFEERIDKYEELASAGEATFVSYEGLKNGIGNYFAKAKPYANFYNAVSFLAQKDILAASYQTKATDAKTELNSDGTKKYYNTDVDKLLADTLEALETDCWKAFSKNKVSAFGTTAATEWAKLSTLANKDYNLQAYRAAAKAKFTTDNGTNKYALSNWVGERKDKVEALQDEYAEKILLAGTVEEIDALVKEAKAAIDAVMTKADVNSVAGKVASRIIAAGYLGACTVSSDGYGEVTKAENGGFASYFDVVVGPATTYKKAIKDGALEAAAQIFVDAVLAEENDSITYKQIDEIIAANKEAAYAALKNVKTTAELKTEAAAVTALINALPKTVTIADKEQVLAAQAAMDAYMENAGAAQTDVSKYATLKTALSTIINAEAREVTKLIRTLPATVTVDDEEKISAARAAYDALEAAYGDYVDSDFSTVAALPSEAKLKTAEGALKKAKLEHAAKLIEALTNNSSKAEVEAAQAAFNALTTEYKLQLNDQLYNKLMAAVAALDAKDIDAVQSLKITASSSAVKGKITVKWKVKGDASVADGYQVYKSTKAQKNYKFMGKTKKTSMVNKKGIKKGTRYFYKVRAYKVVDGVKYYSDWSNKANRIAK